jgi:hypothetical protein
VPPTVGDFGKGKTMEMKNNNSNKKMNGCQGLEGGRAE